jgi:hypothetical protein
MALPIDYDSLRTDESSERASSLEDYKVTCIEFIKDISGDYLEWVEYYKLPSDEDKKRRQEIAAVIPRTNEWIAKISQSIKGIDVVMNDGVQKMAEATAGKPFQIGVFINKKSEYTIAKRGIVDVNVKSAGRVGRKTKLGFHQKEQRFRIETTGKAFFDESNLPNEEFDLMDIHLKLNTEQCKQRDIISFTVIVCEMENGQEMDRRGASTIIHII